MVKPKMCYSDAGGTWPGGARIEDSRVFDNSVFQINLSSKEVSKSSTFRELRGIEEGLKALRSEVTRGAVRWHCDNWGACKIVEYGSTKKDCHEVAVRINKLINKYKVDFEIVWQSSETEEIRFADRVSKDFDFGDYMISDFSGLLCFGLLR